jgi:S1-C subfamily serine protease
VRLGGLPVTPFKAAAEPQQQKPSALGLSLAPVANSQGVTITDVGPDGLGAEKGLAVGDIILDVCNHPVHTPSDIHNAMSRAQDDDDLLILRSWQAVESIVAYSIRTLCERAGMP